MATKHIVCLANSRMRPGRCVAGKAIKTGGAVEAGSWIRPVNGKAGEGLAEGMCMLKNGKFPAVMDIIEISLKKPCPQGHQVENWLNDTSVLWTRTGRILWDDLAGLADDPMTLWENSGRKNDRVSPDAIKNFSCSVCLIKVDDMAIQVRHGWSGKPPYVRGRFTYKNISYELSVTDLRIESNYKKDTLVGQEYSFGECYVTVSLAAMPYENDGNYYKLIAAIIASDCDEEPVR